MTYLCYIETLDGKKDPLEIEVKKIELRDRIKAALKSSIVLFLLAVGFVFIPILHFILVPAFLIASIVVFWMTFSITHKITTRALKCPGCHKEISLKSQSPEFPIRFSCPECQAVFYLNKS
ncbi:MAG: hypothetical protein D6797_06115 [Bdellovibrio sp.]|nr:MAG: hypothetical protein D6797_06115 [Bdellovibrio sp.]